MKEKKGIGHVDRINLQAKVELLFSRINSYVGAEMAKVARVVATKAAEKGHPPQNGLVCCIVVSSNKSTNCPFRHDAE